MTSSRFAVAIHLMASATLAGGEGTGRAAESLTSERMAESVETNPVVVRRILGALREAGLVASRAGPGGGWRTTRPAAGTTLLDAYRAVAPAPVLALPVRCPDAVCLVGRQVQRTLDAVFGEAQAAMERHLAAVSLADIVADVGAGCVGFEPAASRSLGSGVPGP